MNKLTVHQKTINDYEKFDRTTTEYYLRSLVTTILCFE